MTSSLKAPVEATTRIFWLTGISQSKRLLSLYEYQNIFLQGKIQPQSIQDNCFQIIFCF